jgi:hypothetical protein
MRSLPVLSRGLVKRGLVSGIARRPRRLLGHGNGEVYHAPVGAATRGAPPQPARSATRPGDVRRRASDAHSGSRISPAFMCSAISWGVQRPPPSRFVMPLFVTTFISAMRPPPTKKVFPVISRERSLAR